MSKPVHPIALFRLSVLGPLTARIDISHGEIKQTIEDLSKQTYQIPNSRKVHISKKTLERWYYKWLKGGIEALEPKERSDKGRCSLPGKLQEQILCLKKENKTRSIPTIISLIENRGDISRGILSHATVHRFLERHGLASRTKSVKEMIERRAFEAINANDIWYGDVMHGPTIYTDKGATKTYLVTIIDDASRLVCHTRFCEAEDAIAIEYVLKDALLKRGLPYKLIVDNGPAYRAKSLQSICARLGIRLIYGRPYEPQSKGKLERWHRTVREKFLAECMLEKIKTFEALNARLWVWIETVYHMTIQQGLANQQTPLQRYQKDLDKLRSLGHFADDIDDIFYHRVKRTVRKDGTVSSDGEMYEVPYQLAQQKVFLVIDPYTKKAFEVESLTYEKLGKAILLDKTANLNRRRNRPHIADAITNKKTSYIEEVFDAAQNKFDITNLEE